MCIKYPEHGAGTVIAFTADDPEGEDVTWSVVSGADSGDFSIDGSTGVLTFITPPDFEAPSDADTNNTYNVTIQATDDKKPDTPLATGRTAPDPVPQTLVVTVTNLEEAGVVTLTTLQPQEDVAISATLIDPDGGADDDVPLQTGEANLTSDATWQWARSSRATGPWTDIKGAASASHTPTEDDVGMYLRATATYDDGHCTPCDTKKTAHAISVNPVQADPSNQAPRFLDVNGNEIGTEGTTRSVAENSEAGTAVGAPVAATDLGADGRQETLTYSLSGTGGNSFDIDSGTGQIRVKDALDFDEATDGAKEYNLRVTATDPSNASHSVDVTVMVTDVDEAPTIDPPSQSEGHVSREHEENTPADTEVSTYRASDPDGDDASSLKWSLSGRDAASFRIGNYSEPDERGRLYFREAPDYEAPTDAGRDNVYEVTVEVTDRGGNKASRNVTVSVSNVDEPGLLTVSNRNPQVGTRIIATLTDPDIPITNVDWTWRVDGTEDGNTNTYDPQAADVAKTLEVEVSYTDGEGTGRSDTIPLGSIQARPTGSNSRPRFPATTPTRLTINENEAADVDFGVRVTAGDPEDNELTYSMSGGDGAFSIDQDTGQISTRMELDREKRSSYRVTVTAEDPSGARDTHSLTIEVTNVKEPPAITSGDAPTVYYAENGRGSVAAYRAEDPEGSGIVWTVSGDDAQDFTISNGVLRFKVSPNFETKAEYRVAINASDGSLTDTEDITIKIINVDEKGTVTLDHPPREDVVVTADLTDPDSSGQVTSDVDWQWARSSSRSGRFIDIEDDEATANETEGKGASYTPTEDDVGMYLRATATYPDGQQQGVGKTAYVVSRARTLHKMSPEPRFLADDGTVLDATDDNDNNAFETTLTEATPEIKREIAENARAGANVGLPVAAVDIGDNGRPERLTYTLNGADAAKFDIGTSNGQIRVKRGFTPDFEATISLADNCADNDDRCVVTVTVADPNGNSNTVDINIEITDVNESPDLAVSSTAPAGVTGGTLQSGYRHPEPVAGTASESITTTKRFSITFVADDPETGATPNNSNSLVGADDNSADLEWTLTGTDADDFVIGDNPATDVTEEAGVLTFKSGPDFEAPTDSGRNNGYDVTVQVTDNVGNTVSQRVRVTVTNVGEVGKIVLSHTKPEEGAPLTATLTDPDRARSISWKWYRGNADGNDDKSVDDDATESCSADDSADVCAIDRATSATYRPVSADAASELTVIASYTDGEDSGKTEIFTTKDNTVQPEDSTNEPPEFLDANDDRITRVTLEVREDAEARDDVVGVGTTVASPVSATDADADDLLVYTLSGTDARYFEIERSGDNGGQITVGTDTVLDYETRKSYRVTVRALDPSAESAQITVTINVRDVDERPVLSQKGLAALGDGDVLYPENGSDAVGQYTATGPNANNVSWRLSGPDASDFSISRAGQLTFRSTPNFESPADSDRDNIYEITVAARSGSVQDEVAVTVEVYNVDEKGEVTVSPTRSTVGSRITATLTDPDGDISGLDWEWERSRDGNIGWSGIPGATSNSYTSEAEDAGHFLRAVAYYSDGQGAGKSASEKTSAAVLTDDDGVVTLSSDRLAVGDRVTASLRDPDGNVRNVSWQWASSESRTSGWSDIPGATSSTYTVIAADVGNFLRATVRYDDGDGLDKSAEAVSTTVVVEDDDGVVTLSSSSPMVGETVTATLTDPDGGVTGAAWQWASSTDGRSNWTNIARANSRTYTVAAGDVGSYLRATVIYDDAAGAGKSAEAITAAAVTEDDDGSVTLSPSSPEVGERVTAVLSDPDGGVTNRTWQWHISSNGTSSWTIVLGATSSTFAVTETHVGRYLRATASYTDAVGAGKSAEAVTTAAVAPDDDGRATLSETMPTAGDTVTARIDDPDGGVTGETWQWHISPNGASNWVIILGATSSSYTATTANVGSYLRATASYTDSVGPGKSANAVTAAAVAEDDDGRVTLSTRTPEVGSAIRASLSDPDGGVTGEMWQWAKSSNGSTGWTDIQGATSGSYTPGESDAGIFLRATVSYDDAVGTGKGAQAATSSGVAQMELLSEYDANRNESIERSEAIRAVSDYFDGEISKDDVLAVLVLYFSG